MKYIPLLILAAIIAAGCGSSPLSRYPLFPQARTTHSSAVILADALMIDELLGDTAVVNLPENARNGLMCVNMLAGKLNEKGYHVDKGYLSSMGLLLLPDRVFRVARTDDDAHGDPDALNVEVPPFYLGAPFDTNPPLTDSLRTLFFRLARTQRAKGDTAMRYREAVTVGRRFGDDLIFVLLVGGFNVPAGRSSTETASGDYLLGNVPVRQSTEIAMTFYALDASTGEVLWDDRKVRSGGTLHKEKLLEMLGDLVTELP